jgi:signal peptidase I
MQKPSTGSIIRFAIAAITFLLTVIWIGNYWLLLGLPIIFDIYISKKVPWDFWKRTKDGKKPAAWIEWIDALVFALVAVYIINIFLFQNYKIPTSSLEKTMLVGDHLFVSKVSFGPRMPITPIAFPLVQNTFPILNTKSYTEWPLWDYNRLKGFREVKHNDIVVFNFPTGDTVAVLYTNPDYYNSMRNYGQQEIMSNPKLLKDKNFKSEYELHQFVNSLGREVLHNNPTNFGEIVYRPVDRRDNYVKRCIALPGDNFEIRSNQVYINGQAVENPKNLQHNYYIETDGTLLNQRLFDKLEISNEDRDQGSSGSRYILPLTDEMAATVKALPIIKTFEIEEVKADSNSQVFPYSKNCPWSRDNYGPLWMPEAGATVDLTLDNLLIYERIITSYEGNTLDVKGETILINGQPATTYTFKMNYYFMIGDNRHKSADSRYWGFVPEDHIVGRPVLVWLSLNKDKSFPANIRWNRFFKMIKTD